MKKITIENAKIIFRNFKGEADQYNKEGKRSFCLLLEPDIADKLQSLGWSIKTLTPKDEGELELPYIHVTVRFDKVPPKVFLVTSKKKTLLNEDTIETLDWADIEYVDVVLFPYQWEIKNKKEVTRGVKAYLTTMYAKIREDILEEKYSNLPDSNSGVEDYNEY